MGRRNHRSDYNNSYAVRGGESNTASASRFPGEAIEAIPLQVKVYNNFESAMKAFRALVQKERILSLYKEKQSFEQPSEKKRRKRNEMRRKRYELEMKNQKIASGEYEKERLKREQKKQKLKQENKTGK